MCVCVYVVCVYVVCVCGLYVHTHSRVGSREGWCPLILLSLHANVSSGPSSYSYAFAYTHTHTHMHTQTHTYSTHTHTHILYFLLIVFRNSTICHLVHPLCTVLDDSIGCALWFASRGRGLLYPSMQLCQSTARV